MENDDKAQKLDDLDENGNKINREEKVDDKDIQGPAFMKIVLPIFVLAIIIGGAYWIYLCNLKCNRFQLIRVEGYADLSIKAGEIFEKLINEKPDATLGLATGSSPEGLYEYLINQVKHKKLSFAKIKTFNLDEYCDLPISHNESYWTFMHRKLFDSIDIKKENIHLPSGLGDLKKNCDDYNTLLKNNQIDLQLLGIGANGHIGFNEPGTPFDSVTHIVQLTDNTRKANARFFNNNMNEVPKQAITMGIQNILNAKTIVLLASGKAKAQAIRDLIKEKPNVNLPASALKTAKGKVYIIADEEACSLLN